MIVSVRIQSSPNRYSFREVCCRQKSLELESRDCLIGKITYDMDRMSFGAAEVKASFLS